MSYSREQKINIIKWYLVAESADEVVGRFAFTYPGQQIPSRQTVSDIFHRFEKSGCINQCYKCYHENPAARPIPEERVERDINVCAFVEANEPMSSSQISQEIDIPASTVRRVLRKHGYKSYKLKTTQEIFPDDYIRRMEFCEIMREKINENEDVMKNILFTDESSFPLHGRHNPSVARYWSRENEHLRVPLRTQYPQKLNMWAGILGDNIVGPFVINGTLNGERYLQMLQGEIIPAVRTLNINFEEIWFQQDGCPAHNARPVQEFLRTTFPERLICGRGTIPWPARSPDLSPLDFFLWGHLTELVYRYPHERPANLEQLRVKIFDITNSITPEVLSNVRTEFYDRLGYCEAQQGNVFEHLLK